MALNRFLEAQDTGSYEQALAELRAGRKRSHWIWYVFPQLRGLGSSPAAVHYGLDGVTEAESYLAHPVLRERLERAVEAVHAHRAERLDLVMGSHIDALKLVSSLTLFERVAAGTTLARQATEILAAAEAQGFPRCAFTLQRLGGQETT